MTEDLFPEFTPSSKSDWIAQATRDIKGKDFSQVLVSRLWDSIDLAPFYTLEDLPTPAPQSQFHPISDLPGMPPRIWSNMVSVLSGDSNEEVLQALQNGAEGLVLHLYGVEDLSDLLKGVLPQYIPILIQPLGNPVMALKAFLEWSDATGASAESISGGLLWTPSDLCFEQNESYGLSLETFQELQEMTDPYPSFKAFCINTSRYSESGANPLDALVFALGELIEIVDKSGIDPEVIFSKLFLQASVADNHFGEIARLKAFRKAVVRLAKLYSLDFKEENFTLLCQTSTWSKSILDLNTNLIRQTSEAMASVLGGANYLWVKPLYEEDSDEMHRRLARNVSTILKEEAYLDKVQDPAAGSFFIEKITSDILQLIQTEIQNIETNGGWLKALEKGEIHTKTKANRVKVQQAVAEGLISKIGTNTFLAPPALQHNFEFEHFEEKSFQLKPTRSSYLVEFQSFQKS
jgi:methylmalonyl-CoA mutase